MTQYCEACGLKVVMKNYTYSYNPKTGTPNIEKVMICRNVRCRYFQVRTMPLMETGGQGA